MVSAVLHKEGKLQMITVTVTSLSQAARAIEHGIFKNEKELSKLVKGFEVTKRNMRDAIDVLYWLKPANAGLRVHLLKRILRVDVDVWMSRELTLVDHYDEKKLRQWWPCSALKNDREKQMLISAVLVDPKLEYVEHLSGAAHRHLDNDGDWMHDPFVTNDAQRQHLFQLVQQMRDDQRKKAA